MTPVEHFQLVLCVNVNTKYKPYNDKRFDSNNICCTGLSGLSESAPISIIDQSYDVEHFDISEYEPVGIAYNPDNNRLYVANYRNNSFHL
jgi:DNA-binding beta-propeller fold protein YncE